MICLALRCAIARLWNNVIKNEVSKLGDERSDGVVEWCWWWYACSPVGVYSVMEDKEGVLMVGRFWREREFVDWSADDDNDDDDADAELLVAGVPSVW